MNTPTKIALAIPIVLISWISATWLVDGCFTYHDETDTEHTRNEGGELNPDQKLCVEKAIGMIKSMSVCLGGTDGQTSGATPGGGGIITDGGTTFLSDFLTERLAKGDICVEKGLAKNDPKVAASASRNEANFTGHPGINIRPDMLICKAGPQAPENTLKTFQLAMILIHEASHVSNPNNAANSPKEFEVTAFQYTAKTLCAALDGDCISILTSDPAEMTELEKAACDEIKVANSKICEGGGDQVACDYCADEFDIDVVQAPCPPVVPDTPHEGQGASAALSSVGWDISRFKWGVGSDYAEIELVPWTANLRVKATGANGVQEINIPLSNIDGDSVNPISIGLLSKNSLIVGLNVHGTISGKIIRIDLDNDDVGLPYSITTLYSGSGLAWPSSVFVDQDKPTVIFVFDESTHRVLILKTVSGVLTEVATPALAPTLQDCRFIQASPSVYTTNSGQAIPSRSIICSPLESFNPIYDTNTYLIDIDNDWIIDVVENSL